MRRRSLLTGSALALAGLGLVTWALPALAADGGAGAGRIKHIVVIYEENHSFDNLYGLWPGADGVVTPANGTPNQVQVGQGGAPYDCLEQNDPQLTSPPLAATCTDPRGFTSAFTNQVFGIDNYVPQNQKTEDLVHRYYQEQYQIDGGKMDRFTTGSDAVGLPRATTRRRTCPCTNTSARRARRRRSSMTISSTRPSVGRS
jgi:phospholipase C